jgi:hypothetical protein
MNNIYMDNTTSILDLPTYSPQLVNQTQNQNSMIDENQIRQIVSGIQDASLHGATTLNSVDIPKNNVELTNDPQITPNYIPPIQPNINPKYIQEPTNIPNIISTQNSKFQNKQLFDNIYDEIQMPLIVSVLFFIFQLPLFKRYLNDNFKFLHYIDGSMNLTGHVVFSILFGLLYYIINIIIFRYT